MLWWGLLVPQTGQGHTGDPFARPSTHISEKLKRVWHPGQPQICCSVYTAVSPQEWATVILQGHFSIRLNQLSQASRRQTQILFQKLPVLPAPFCTKTSICLAKISLCSVSFNLDHFLGLLLWKSKKGPCRMRDKNRQAAAPASRNSDSFSLLYMIAQLWHKLHDTILGWIARTS